MSPQGTPRTHGSRQGIGKASDKRSPRKGQRVVVAAHSTGEGGEVRPKRPTGGKAPSGRASAGRRQGRDFELTNPNHRQPVDCRARNLARAAAALLEEPDACIAHVRVCGGAGWVTTGSTRQPTPTAFARASLWLLARLTASVRCLWRGGKNQGYFPSQEASPG